MRKLIDLTGQKFGEYTVLGIGRTIKYSKSSKVMWKCRCSCGAIREVNGSHLRSGKSKSCGHITDYTGQRFGRLLVLERAENKYDKAGRSYVQWKCKCDCGRITYVTSNNLGTHTTSCGCFLKEVAGKQTIKHGYRKTRLYTIYNGMKQRCNNPKSPEYKNYGGRGITVCEEWNKSDGLKAFAEWALANGYKDNLTIERIDVNGNYEPGNCTWIPRSEQGKNTTKNVHLEYKGEKMILADFSRMIGVDQRKVSRELKKGKSVEEIVARYKK